MVGVSETEHRNQLAGTVEKVWTSCGSEGDRATALLEGEREHLTFALVAKKKLLIYNKLHHSLKTSVLRK